MRYVREDGTELTEAEVLEDLNVTIKELEAQLASARRFKIGVQTETLTSEGSEDSYLSFGIVTEEGYDRTGPSFVGASDKEEALSIYREYKGLQLGFSREAIKAAKEGVHQIAWSPNGPTHPCTVTKVRGFHVWVRQLDAELAVYSPFHKLNHGASALLMKGGYR